MKKILSAVLTAALIFTPIGSVVFQDQPTTVEAKSYKSGKKSFNSNNNRIITVQIIILYSKRSRTTIPLRISLLQPINKADFSLVD